MTREEARSVTDGHVGSGALLGGADVRQSGVKQRTASGEAKVLEG